MKAQSTRRLLTMGCAALMVAGFVDTRAAYAGGYGIGGMIGGAIGGAIGSLGRQPYRSSRERHGPKDDDNTEKSSDSNQSRDDRVLSSLAPSPQRQMAVLKSITTSDVLGMVGQTKDLVQVGKTSSADHERDYTALIGDIIARFKNEQIKARSTVAGDVTQHAIEQSLDRAYKEAKLNIFESFLGENWSAERLRVMVLQRVKDGLDFLFTGNNRGNAPMEELDHLITRSADAVYHRVFEISELLAENRSSALFVQRLYQTHGDLVDNQIREVTDRMITKSANWAIAKFDSLMRRDEDGFALRYRAQRVVFDCLSENVERLSSSETGIKTAGEINQKVGQISTTICAEWLDHQFGTDKDKLKPQKPMPLRAIWSSSGPKDDPSMYGRVGSTL